MKIEEFVENIEKNKIAIIRIWINKSNPKRIIKNSSIDEDLFIKRYSFGVIEHYIKVIRNNEQIEKSHSIIDFLRYLKKLNLKASEIFLLFSAFKDSLIEFSFFIKANNQTLEESINSHYDRFFSDILDVYTKSISQIENALNKSIDIVDRYVIMSRTDVNGIITSVSTAFCKISEYEPFELIGKSHHIVKHPDTPKELFEDLWKNIRAGKTWQGEIKNRKKSGDYYWIKITILPNLDNLGNIISYDAIGENISSKKELIKQQNLLIEQSKSAALGEMISMIAHQWRQPLQVVSILIQKLPIFKTLKGEISDEMLDEVVSQVGVQLEYMSKTIDDFRDYFKPNKKKEEVYITNIIDKSIDFLSYLFKMHDIKVRYKNESQSKIEIFFNEMVQVFVNLGKNSCDAMLDKAIENRLISIYSYEKENKLIIEFEDNAGGIKPDIISKIFEPYFSTKNNKNGTGLGLYMSKAIIEQHSFGKINVLNTQFGTKFIIELPLG